MTAEPYGDNVWRPLATIAELREQKLTIPQAANALNVSTMTVRRLIQRGELRAYKFGHGIRIPLTAVREYLEAAKVDPGRTS